MTSQGTMEALQAVLGGRVIAGESLRLHTTWHAGGPANWFLRVDTVGELQQVLLVLRTREVPHLVLGGGANTLFDDQGYHGAVLQLGAGFRQVNVTEQTPTLVRVEAGAGVRTSGIVLEGGKQGWGRVDVLAGIPGTLGGAVAMNAGTREGETRELLESVQMVSAENVAWIPAQQLGLGYRHSQIPTGFVITTVRLRFAREDSVILQQRIQAHLERRKASQPIDFPSAGSVFKNPPGQVAGRLIEEAGLKGTRIGDAQISQRHGNFIVNLGQATSRDIRELILLARRTVQRRCGIDLELETRILDAEGEVWHGA